jgi:integral membrane sensor domain MASE1
MSALLSRKFWERFLQVPPGVLAAIGVAVGYYASAQLAFLIGTLSDGIFAPFWPPNVILFCGLLLRPRRQWPAILATTLLAHVLAESSVGMPAGQCWSRS